MSLPSRPRIPSSPGHCATCGTWRASLHTDHIIPRWRGGADTSENYQRLCANCHEDKTREERQSPEYRAFQSEAMTARMLSPEAKQKISAAVRTSNKYRDWLAHSRHKCGWNRGKKLAPFSQEHRERIAASKKGKALSDEHRQALSAARKGKPWSELRRARHEAKYSTEATQ